MNSPRLRQRFSVWMAMLAMLLGSAGLVDASAAKPPATPQPAAGALAPQAQLPDVVAWIDVSGPVRDAPPPYAWVDREHAGLSMRRLVRTLERIAGDKQYVGVVINLDGPELELTQVDELTRAIQLVRDAGKPVLAFAEQYDMTSYLLACACDKILLQHKGQVQLNGLGVEEMYFSGLLEKVGVKADFLQVGQFKGAEEPFTRAGPSEPWSQNIDALLNDLYEQFTSRIAAARGLTREQVEQVFADCWSMTDQQYVARRVVDQLTDRDLSDVSEQTWGEDFEWVDVLEAPSGPRVDNPLAIFRMLFQEPARRAARPTIAIVNADGPITSGFSRLDGDASLFGGTSIGSRTLVRVFGDIRDDDNIKGVIVRIDSPGGSALASEVIWQALREVGEQKPVYVSVGSMAASGGYYIASAGHEVYVLPDTVVGSIGVVGGKFILGGLYEKVGISVHRRSRGPNGDMFNSVTAFTPQQRAALQQAFQNTYEQFQDRIRIGRGRRIADIEAVAQGRLFTGRQAVENGLADRLGGVDVALADMAGQLGLEAGKYDVADYPEPLTFPEFLEQLFGGRGGRVQAGDAAAGQALRRVLGPRAWRAAQPVLGGLSLMEREHVLLLLPAALVIR